MAVDATVVAPPGPKRDYWMVHTVFDLSRLRLCSVVVANSEAIRPPDSEMISPPQFREIVAPLIPR